MTAAPIPEGNPDSTHGDSKSSSPVDENSPSEEPEALLERAAGEPDGIAQLARLRRPISISAAMQTGIFIMLFLGFVYFAKQLLLPVALAMLLNFLMSPFARWAERLQIPRFVSGFVLTGGLALLVSGTVYMLSGPAGQFVEDARYQIDELEAKLRDVSAPIAEVKETARQVEEATASESDATVVEVRGPGLLGAAVSYAQSFGSTLVAALILLLFLISSDEIFLHKLVRVLPTFSDKRLAVQIFRQIERDISYYLLTITAINCLLGTTAALMFWLVGVPNPVLWGIVVGSLNYIPYLGPGIAMLLLAFVGLISFETLSMGSLPPLIVLGLNLLEANAITPMVVGKRLDLNPVIIFLALAFWGFLWGIPGMIVAVPLLVALKSVCDHVEPFAPISEFLSGATPAAITETSES